MTDFLEVRRAEPGEYREALLLVFSALSPELARQQMIAVQKTAKRKESTLNGLFVAYSSGQLLGATLVNVFPGATAGMWQPQIQSNDPTTVCAKLLRHVDDYLSKHDIRLVQCLLETNTGLPARLLQNGGYSHLADLLYLASSKADFRQSSPESGLSFKPYNARDRQKLQDLLLRTYEETKDCPALDGIRQADDILDGYEATGLSGTDFWFLITGKMGDMGCLLMADHPEDDQCELVYVGLIPSARGCGWGLKATSYAQWLTQQAGRQRLILAVDAENDPAIRMYAESGFSSLDRRSVFLKIFQQQHT